MNAADQAVAEMLRTCRQHDVKPSRHLVIVHIASQTLSHLELAYPNRDSRNPLAAAMTTPLPIGWGEGGRRSGEGFSSFYPEIAFENHPTVINRKADPNSTAYVRIKTYRCSTSKFGIGSVANSNCTPLGLHRIVRKIGGGWPGGSVFKGRQHVGYTWDGLPFASITDRIFWLAGLEPGRNRGGNVDTFARYIYIHGTGDEPTLGRPASHGCIHLGRNDLLPLYDRLPLETLVWIAEN